MATKYSVENRALTSVHKRTEYFEMVILRNVRGDMGIQAIEGTHADTASNWKSKLFVGLHYQEDLSI